MPAPQGYIISQPYLGLGSIIFGNWRFCGIIIIRSSGYKDKSDSHRVHLIGWLIMHQNSIPKNTCSLRGTSSNLSVKIFARIYFRDWRPIRENKSTRKLVHAKICTLKVYQ